MFHGLSPFVKGFGPPIQVYDLMGPSRYTSPRVETPFNTIKPKYLHNGMTKHVPKETYTENQIKTDRMAEGNQSMRGSVAEGEPFRMCATSRQPASQSCTCGHEAHFNGLYVEFIKVFQ